MYFLFCLGRNIIILIVLRLIDTQVFMRMSMPNGFYIIGHRHLFIVFLLFLHCVIASFSVFVINYNEGF